MAIRKFSVGARRGLAAAAVDGLPNLAAIAGPNGSGKSALLEQLWQQRNSLLEPGTEALYVGPNRTWRAGPLSDLAARSFTQDYEQVLKAETLPGFQYIAPGGFNFLSGMSRFGSNADDAQALVKTSIVRIANRAENFIAQEYRRQGGQIAHGSVPDLLQPFGLLIDTLLPHLQFHQVDASNPSNIQVLFGPSDPERAAQRFDIDDLSSGEKAAIALFLPFIERQIRSMTGEATLSVEPQVVPLTLLLDEPEIHLHPLLQLNVLEYMRRLARLGEAQFIFTTHSPSLLDALDPDELYLLSPASIAPDNQLSQLSQDFEKLEVARAITGATHVLTRGKPIVFVEGEPDVGPTASDQRLMRLLAPEVDHWAVVPSHGRSQVVRAVNDMRSAQLALPGLPVFGIVDGDQGVQTGSDHVIAWPVAMVENLLLDPESIATVLSPYGALALSGDTISRSLTEIAESRRDDEVRLRVQAALPISTIRPDGADVEEIKETLRSAVSAFEARIDDIDVVAIISAAQGEVESILDAGSTLERFRGKPILREFYRRHGIASAGLGWNAFVTELARTASRAIRTQELVQPAVQQIRLYFPSEIRTLLEGLPSSSERDELLALVSEARRLWESAAPTGEGREELRDRLLHLARSLRSGGDPAGDTLLRLAASIGTAS
jgi:ABC-type hemin transport system ATPase subunit